jgi:UDPglucose 6-dehydrogenase
MRVTVAGLWHLGAVTAACCAHGGHNVVAFDDDSAVVANLTNNKLPVDEPGLADLTSAGVSAHNLTFTDKAEATANRDVLWICYDTPVDENDIADTDFVYSRIEKLVRLASPGTLVLISSQLPVGSTARMNKIRPDLTFAYSPENLRLGKAIDVFLKPDRVVVGVRDKKDTKTLSALFAPFAERIEWMSIESAEMTKHAINAFLATSVAFINEIATICEKSGADASEVERGLKSDLRIGPKAYLHPGSAFAGGTLARDIVFLTQRGKNDGMPVNLLNGVNDSNNVHKSWARRRLSELLGDLKGKTVCVLGLTYKPGTNTLRRSTSVDLCRWLMEQGASVQAFDPAIFDLPEDLTALRLKATAELALETADAAVIATSWPEFRSIPSLTFVKKMRRALVLDPDRHLGEVLCDEHRVEYFGIGVANEISS